MKRAKRDLQIDDMIFFHSGNFDGWYATITRVDWESKHPEAIYGIWHEAKLQDGRIINIEKTEHWEYA